MSDEYAHLITLHQQLTEQLTEVRAQMAALNWRYANYRIALRPDEEGADPFHEATLLDDIVVQHPTLFRAEQMDCDSWSVACYLDDEADRICWSVTAHTRPTRIEWTTTEWPQTTTYEGIGRR